MPAPSLPLSRAASLLFCLLAAAFELLAYSASDMVMPGMPGIVDEFGVAAWWVPLALGSYLVGGVLVQWLAGPWSDDVGRRPLMLAGGLLFVVASLGLSTVDSMTGFIAWRLLQGSSLGIVVAVVYPAVQEAFDDVRALRVTALLANIALLSPLLAPLAGVWWLAHLDWRAMFLAQGGLAALVTLGLFFAMPETVGSTRADGSVVAPRRFRWDDILRDSRVLLRHRLFLSSAVAIGLVGAPLVAWIALSPLLLMRQLGLSDLHYAQLQLPVFGALISGNLLLFRVADRYRLPQLIGIGAWPLAIGAVIASAAALVPSSATSLALATAVAGLSVYAFGIGIVNTTLYRLALFAPDSGTGTCAAMLGTVTVALFCLGGLLAGATSATLQPQGFGAAMASLGVLALVVLRRVRRQLAASQNPHRSTS